MTRQDFLLQPYNYDGEIVWDFPLDDFYLNGVLQPTPYGDSDTQHKIDIIVNNIGSIKQFPLLGFGLIKHLNSESNIGDEFNELSKMMKSDGYKVGVGAVKSGTSGLIIDIKKITPAY